MIKTPQQSANVIVKNHVLLFLAMAFVLAKIVCNPLFFRNIEVNLPFINYVYKSTASVITYPIIYILIDLITMLKNRGFAIIIIISGIICDGFFSLYISAVANHNDGISAPVEIFGKNMWQLFLHGILGTCIASLLEVSLFSYLLKKLHNFFISTFISISLVFSIHNILTDFYIMRNDLDRNKVIICNTFSETAIMVGYLLILMIFIRLTKIKYLIRK